MHQDGGCGVGGGGGLGVKGLREEPYFFDTITFYTLQVVILILYVHCLHDKPWLPTSAWSGIPPSNPLPWQPWQQFCVPVHTLAFSSVPVCQWCAHCFPSYCCLDNRNQPLQALLSCPAVYNLLRPLNPLPVLFRDPSPTPVTNTM